MSLRKSRTLSDWLPPPVRAALDVEPSDELENRAELIARTGKVSIPYLIDPNTDSAMFESRQILAYLDDTYRAAST